MRNLAFQICLLALSIVLPTQAEPLLAPLFRDHAVLQHGKPVPVWGNASAGEVITVSFAGQTQSTTADSSGKWSILLSPLPPSSEGRTLVVIGTTRVEIEDILVGEVWLASGQSNMAMRVETSRDNDIERLIAHWPQIREFKVTLRESDTPVADAEGEWLSAITDQVAGFGAVSYFFARDLHLSIGVPIGIINSTWGGTPVESWLSPESATREHGPVFTAIHQRWQEKLDAYPAARAAYLPRKAEWDEEKAKALAAGQSFNKRPPPAPIGRGHRTTPNGLYNGMIHPLTPYALSGIIWYQGEANAARASEYRDLFPALITGWREAFGQGDLPFFWSQLTTFRSPNHPATADWAELRAAQTSALVL